MSADPKSVVTEYEVFGNNKNALAFFMYRQESLDKLNDGGPFYFVVPNDNTIIAGSDQHNAIFPNVKQDIIALAKERKVIMLVEFENEKPYRCTPCYYRDIPA